MTIRHPRTGGFLFVPAVCLAAEVWFLAESDWTWRYFGPRPSGGKAWRRMPV